jgi:hypothetical protein
MKRQVPREPTFIFDFEDENAGFVMNLNPDTGITRVSPRREKKMREAPVPLNVGGTRLDVSLQTLTENFPESKLAHLFLDPDSLPRDKEGHYFIDADPMLFGHIINVMRRPSLVTVLPKNISCDIWQTELDYWGLSPDFMVREKHNEYLQERTKCLAQFAKQNKSLVSELLKFVDFTQLSYERGDDNEKEYLSRLIPEGVHHFGVTKTELVQYVIANENDVMDLLSDIMPHHEINLYTEPIMKELDPKQQETLEKVYGKSVIKPEASIIQLGIVCMESNTRHSFITVGKS